LRPANRLAPSKEASRGVLLGRDTFSTGSIKSGTIESALAALDSFREIIDGYDVKRPRRRDQRGPRGPQRRPVSRSHPAPHRHHVRDHRRGRGEPAGLPRRQAGAAARPALRGAWTLLTEVGGGSTSLTLLRQGEPNRSAVYALGAVRLRQQLDLHRLSHEVQLSLLKRSIANMIEEIRVDNPLRRVTYVVAIGGDALRGVADPRGRRRRRRP
jgi:exopolyphosphatase/pppGpp-phosphohydrolase